LLRLPIDFRVRDVEVEVRAFFLACCTLLNVLVRKGKGPEGRKNLAQGARSCEKIETGFFAPRVLSNLRMKKSCFSNFFTASPALGPESPLVRGSPSGAKEKVSTRELSLVLPPLPGLDRRLGLVSQGLRSCEKINNLTQRRQGAKIRKEQPLCFLCAFYDFAPLREMLLLIQGLFHSFLRPGLSSIAR
jgi:hypothetical protein